MGPGSSLANSAAGQHIAGDRFHPAGVTMSDDQQPSLQIDTDWKKQAQEEKRKLAERTQQPAAAPAAPGLLTPGSGAAAATGTAPAAGPTTPTPGGREGRGRRELPQAGMASLVNSLLTQVLLYLGEIATAAGPMVDL